LATNRREIKAYVILESEIDSLKTIFYSEIVLDFISIALMALCFYLWAYLPNMWWWSIEASIVSFLCGAIGVFLSIIQTRLWRNVRAGTVHVIDLPTPSTLLDFPVTGLVGQDDETGRERMPSLKDRLGGLEPAPELLME
jgi:hypothetical protein